MKSRSELVNKSSRQHVAFSFTSIEQRRELLRPRLVVKQEIGRPSRMRYLSALPPEKGEKQWERV